MKRDLTEQFACPSSAYRGKPFWAWNGPLDPDELRRQIRFMHEMGLGGFFMHSRVGLATPYLSDEWMACIQACVDEARALDMEAGLYDEDRWPSGAAGGLVTCDKRYRQRMLVCEKRKRGKSAPEGTLASFAVKKRGGVVREYRRLRKGQRAGGDETVYDFHVRVNPESDWYNGQTYLDTMNHDAVKKFIRVTYEAYRKRFGGDFGRIIPGVFTDEPNYGHSALQADGSGSLPWTDRLPEVFRKRYGYDVVKKLPELFFDLADGPVSAARYHYHDCTTHLFVDAFSRQIGEWCGRNKLLFTGHVLAEQTPRSQTSVVGSAMRFYEFMQAPGIDVLTEKRPELDTAKQCSSVLRQMGRMWALSETYGCTGWDFPFEGHKAIGDWQAAMGINLRCQHLYWYTMLGQAKRDYPASIAHQSPWWRLYAYVEDYFARLNLMLIQGEPVRDLLVVHPVESTWTRYVGGNKATKDMQALDERLEGLREILLQGHVDFDYGDEEMLGRLGSVKRTKDGPRFVVGKASYRAVLLPNVLTVRQSTLDLMKRFAEKGGTVVMIGEPPEHVDAKPSAAAKSLAADAAVTQRADRRSAILRAVEPARALSIRDDRGREVRPVLYHLRDAGDARVLFVCNTDRSKGFPEVRITCAGRAAEEWDLIDGGRTKALTTRDGNDLVIHTSLPASGSRLFVIRDEAVKGLPAAQADRVLRRRRLAPRTWKTRRSEANVLVLDRPEWKLGDGSWQPALEILKVDQQCRDALGLRHRGGQMVQPWARPKNVRGPSSELVLRYTIDASALPEGPVELAVEQPERFAIALNGTPVNTDADTGWWVDRSLRRLPLSPDSFHLGENTLMLCTTFERESDLESLFLLGEFGVKVQGERATLVPRPDTLRTGDWTRQGLPFYSGAVTYTCNVKNPVSGKERLVLELPRWAGACVCVTVDGEPAGIVAWPPHELDLTDAAPKGVFELGITVMSHRRNSHGPLHMKHNPKGGWIGPAQFITEEENWTDDYILVPAGLLAAPELSVRRRAEAKVSG